jgi:hypothetical protein
MPCPSHPPWLGHSNYTLNKGHSCFKCVAPLFFSLATLQGALHNEKLINTCTKRWAKSLLTGTGCWPVRGEEVEHTCPCKIRRNYSLAAHECKKCGKRIRISYWVSGAGSLNMSTLKSTICSTRHFIPIIRRLLHTRCLFCFLKSM